MRVHMATPTVPFRAYFTQVQHVFPLELPATLLQVPKPLLFLPSLHISVYPDVTEPGLWLHGGSGPNLQVYGD